MALSFTPETVKKIHEATSYQDANDYLSVGWILISTYKTCYDPIAFPDHQTIHYVLAWAKEDKPSYPKPSCF